MATFDRIAREYEGLLALESRLALSAAVLDADHPTLSYFDLDGDQVTVTLAGPGEAHLDFIDAAQSVARRLNAASLVGTDESSQFHISVMPNPALDRILVPPGTYPGTTRVRQLTADVIGAISLDRVILDGAGIIASRVAGALHGGSLFAGADIVVADWGPAGEDETGSLLQLDRVESTRGIRSFILSPGAPRSVDVGGPTARISGLSIKLGRTLASLHIDSFDPAADVDVDIPGIEVLAWGAAQNSAIRAGALGDMTFSGPTTGLTILADSVAALHLNADTEALNLSTAGSTGLIDGTGSIRRSSIQAGGDLNWLVLTGGNIEDTSIRVDGRIGAIAAIDNEGRADSGLVRRTVIRSLGSMGSVISSGMESVRARSGDTIHHLGTRSTGAPGSGRASAVQVATTNGVGQTSFARGASDPSNVILSNIPFGSTIRGDSATAVAGATPGVPWTLDAADVEAILDQAVARAAQLGVNATISVTDHEGNILGALRMTDSALLADPGVVTIGAGGTGGLEGVPGIPSSIIATTKAGTAAFLSTSGNAFSTRTAGYIIQQNFPPGIRFQASGPLFGVQFSSLPTSDINTLPLGLSADPGGLPLYLGSDAVGGIGVELDGTYTVDTSRVGGSPTAEELIALAGQSGFTPPDNIRADRILINGIRLDYANAEAPAVASLGVLPILSALALAGDVTVFITPRDAPASMFTPVSLGGITGNTVSSFISGGTFTPVAGDVNAGQQLTADDVSTILTQSHQLNARLRAMIRRDSPQVSQVSASVVDQNGNLLGVFRSADAPVFGFDVSVQKARSAAFFSRADAGALLSTAGGGDFASYAARAAAVGINLDGSIALSERAIGFLARPLFPDGIPNTPAGPFSVGGSDVFSPFSTGLQVDLLTTNLVAFLNTFIGIGNEGTALAMFDAGLIGGSGVADSSLGLDNGLQIFPGAVPLYKNGVLVGAVGVSGDGIEQDDYVSWAGATGYQQTAGLTTSDNVVLTGPGLGFRLPYVKLPRAPFTGA